MRDHVPCKNTSGQSACCKTDHYCFDNGLCLDNSQMTTYRGTCTDRNWESSACAKYCLINKDGSPSTQVCGVWVCNNNNRFACDLDECGNSTRRFIVNGGTLQRNQAVDDVLGLSTSTSTSTSSTRPSTTVTQTLCPSSDMTSQQSCPSHTGALAGVGAGLGIPLLIALVALVVLFMRLRRGGTLLKGQTPHHHGSVNGGLEYTQLQGDKLGYMSYTQELADPNNRSLSGYKGSPSQEAPNNIRYAHRPELASS